MLEKFLHKNRKIIDLDYIDIKIDMSEMKRGSEVAKRLRKNQAFVSKSESGDRRVDVIELRAFARLYRKPLDYFLE